MSLLLAPMAPSARRREKKNRIIWTSSSTRMLQQASAVGLVMPQANTEAMAHHLQALSEAVPAGRHAVLVLDRAGWHTTPKLAQFPNVSLLPLPAGSPELNPTEQVWQQLRDRHLANRCYDGYEQIVDACCEAWNAFTQIPDAIRSLCSRS